MISSGRSGDNYSELINKIKKSLKKQQQQQQQQTMLVNYLTVFYAISYNLFSRLLNKKLKVFPPKRELYSLLLVKGITVK